MSYPQVIIDPYCLYEIAKVTHFQWIRLRKHLLELQACNRREVLNQDHRSCEKVGKIWPRES